jgi:hypothetical protein
MYNSTIPSNDELPTNKQLISSTLIALVVALLLLITCILPAEYGVDPTGIGRTLGLTQMGEIKEQLAHEAAQDDTSPVAPTSQTQPAQALSSSETPQEAPKSEQAASQPPVKTAVEPELSPKMEASVTTESFQVTLQPGEAAEVKLTMNKSSTVNYHWSVDQGHVNFDTHADNKQVKYHNYNKGKAVQEDKGVMTAAFNGKHGWFWRNRSGQTVTVTLNVSGDFSELSRVL